jgi:hypothetical protein
VRLRHGDAKAAFAAPGDSEHCRAWYAVEPEGYVCSGSEATLDPTDPEVVELVRTKADIHSPWPYRYGESLGVALWSTLPPPPANQPAALHERDHTPAFVPLGPTGRSLLREIVAGSTVAYSDTFDHQGRAYLLTWDRSFAEAAKIRPYPMSSFHGVVLGDEIRLPIAFFREDGGGDKLERLPDGSFAATGERWPRLGSVMLTGRSETIAALSYFETRDGAWCRAGDVGVARQSPPPLVIGRMHERKTWIDISILNGTLVAYEDRTPVYVTLISPGRGAMPVPGIPVLQTASTPTGTFAVLGKFTTATMVSSSRSTLIHSEVQYTQNFDGPYSLHGAYWHDRFGHGKSGGCVNLSPIDSRRLFAWTDPPLPDGWHGMRSIDLATERTVVSIHR